jgi:signal transduction histidine kinase
MLKTTLAGHEFEMSNDVGATLVLDSQTGEWHSLGDEMDEKTAIEVAQKIADMAQESRFPHRALSIAGEIVAIREAVALQQEQQRFLAEIDQEHQRLGYTEA